LLTGCDWVRVLSAKRWFIHRSAAALSKFGGYDTSLRWVSGDDDDGGDACQRVRLQAFINSGGASDYDGISRALSR
jgi:hypothetical protein